jgi:streptogramin lyase
VAGPDGNLWFTDAGHNSIDRFTTDGALTTYTLPPAPTNANPGEITAGPDGNLWFLEGNGVPVVKVGKITTAGVITEYATKAGSTSGITAGPDGNIWFNERDQFAVARMTPTGTETQYLIPGGANGGPNIGANPVSITSGPDGNLWVTRGRRKDRQRGVRDEPPALVHAATNGRTFRAAGPLVSPRWPATGAVAYDSASHRAGENRVRVSRNPRAASPPPPAGEGRVGARGG